MQTSGRIRHVALLGECMLELQGPAFGTMRQTFGGDTLNTAVYLARCGAATGVRASYVTALGDDPLSEGLVERWRAEGVGTQWVQRLPGRLPGLYLIELDAQGERRFHYWRDSAAVRSLFDAPVTPFEAALDTVDLLYLSGISLAVLPAAGRERLFAAIGRLRARGARLAFDANFRPRLWPDRAEALRWYERAFDSADIAFVSTDELQALHGAGEAEAAFSLAPPELVVKQGTGPTLVRAPGGSRHTLPVPAVVAVDTTAAGDSFAGGYLSRRLAGCEPAVAAAFGQRLAARVVQHPGAIIPAAAMADLAAERLAA